MAEPWFERGSIAPSVLMGGFTTIGGILYGYDAGLIAGVLAMDTFKQDYGVFDPAHGGFYLPPMRKSIIVSALSIGLFTGACSTGSIADVRGRRIGLILACLVFMVGVFMQGSRTSLLYFTLGRLVSGFGVGQVSSMGPLYQAEISPKHLRGAITAAYHSAKTFGVLTASIVDSWARSRPGKSSYLIPVFLQLVPAVIMLCGFLFLPESPRFLVKANRMDDARTALARIRHLPADDSLVTYELSEIEASIELERSQSEVTIADCFKKAPNRQRYRMVIGIVAGAMSQLVGVNFIKYFGTDFFLQAGITNSFLVTIATNSVSFCMTIPSLFLIERLGRRPFLSLGLFACFVTQYIISITGIVFGRDSESSHKMLVIFTILYIAVESCGAGPPLLVVIGETFPLRTRAKSIALSIGIDYFFNFLISYFTPFLVDDAPGSLNMGTNVFFIWGTSSLLGSIFVYFFVYETKGLTLEQIDEVYNTVPLAWQSTSFKPTSTLALSHDVEPIVDPELLIDIAAESVAIHTHADPNKFNESIVQEVPVGTDRLDHLESDSESLSGDEDANELTNLNDHSPWRR
ncbi:general substrate transporter [Lipomyces oligophaga]|uniref:general substrate transporter n=1 Tax=Lipomyces oligophaga TaxID=45792 RepID=UPI0034CDB1FB